MAVRQKFPLVLLVLLAAGCATEFRVRGGAVIPNDRYNREIARQGIDHYCSSGACDIPPALVHAVMPTHPVFSGGPREGIAVVLFDIEADGSVSNVRLESASAREFGDAALKAVPRWRFRAAQLNGRPVRFEAARQEIPFARH